jgi:hypothetical protein
MSVMFCVGTIEEIASHCTNATFAKHVRAGTLAKNHLGAALVSSCEQDHAALNPPVAGAAATPINWAAIIADITQIALFILSLINQPVTPPTPAPTS